MNPLVKGLIATFATIFGFALIAAGVSVRLAQSTDTQSTDTHSADAPSADTSSVKRDKVVVKPDDG